MQVRKMPMLLSFVATLTLLFGCWFLYQKAQVEEPLRKEVEQMTSAQLVNLQVSKDQVLLQLHVTKPDVFPDEYKTLLKAADKLISDKKLDIQLTNQGANLKQVMADQQFALNEAVELHQYSKIPELMADLKTSHHLEQAIAKIDETTIYIYLKNGAEDYFAMIPRLQEQSGVTQRA